MRSTRTATTKCVVAAAPLDALTLVEDELLLSLPYAPTHADGECAAPRVRRAAESGRGHGRRCSPVRRGIDSAKGERHGCPAEQEVAVEARHASRARLSRPRPRSPSSRSAAKSICATTSARAAITAARRSSRPRPTNKSRRCGPSRRGPFARADSRIAQARKLRPARFVLRAHPTRAFADLPPAPSRLTMPVTVAVDAMGGDHGPAGHGRRHRSSSSRTRRTRA